jgi:hypothetical protein
LFDNKLKSHQFGLIEGKVESELVKSQNYIIYVYVNVYESF